MNADPAEGDLDRETAKRIGGGGRRGRDVPELPLGEGVRPAGGRTERLPAAISEEDDVLTAGLNRALVAPAEKEVRESRSRKPKRVLRELGPDPDDGAPSCLNTRHYGPFVAHRRRHASVPEDVAPGSLTVERGRARLGDGSGGGGSARARAERRR